MLETIREYAQERLEASGEAEAARRRHAEYYLALAEKAEPQLVLANQGEWLERLTQMQDNLRAALDWMIDRGELELAARLSSALWRFLEASGDRLEGLRWLELVLDERYMLPTALRTKALNAAGYLAIQVDEAMACGYFKQSITLARMFEDKQSLAFALLGLAQSVDIPLVLAPLEESLALYRELDDRHGLAWVLGMLGHIAISERDFTQAKACFAESLAHYHELGDTGGIAWTLSYIGFLDHICGDDTQAAAHFAESLALFQDIGEARAIAWALHRVGEAAFWQGDGAQAVACHTESLTLYRTLGDEWGCGWALQGLGDVAIWQGDVGQAVTYFTESIAIYRNLNHQPMIGVVLTGFVEIAVALGQADRGARLASAIATLMKAHLDPHDLAVYDQTVALARAQLDEATFDTAWAAGQALSLDEAIGEALNERGQP